MYVNEKNVQESHFCWCHQAQSMINALTCGVGVCSSHLFDQLGKATSLTGLEMDSFSSDY